jgi:multimeric flavodoxin WrbA
MKVIAINSSPREGGNTEIMCRTALEPLEAAGVETEYLRIGGKPVHGCTGCRWCFKNPEQKRCVFDDDPINECIAKMMDADGILLASPTYFTDVTTEMKALIDRAGFVGIAAGRCFKHKVGAAIVAVRRGGSIHVFDTINHLFLYHEMLVVGSIYWNLGIGLQPGDVRNDEEGLRTMTQLGENMAWALEKLGPTASEG